MEEDFADNIGSSEGESMLSLYPNPVNEHLQISIAANASGGSFAMLDVTGRQVAGKDFQLDENGQYNEDMDVSHLAQGVYYVSCRLDNGEIVNVKFIKQ